jgi:hypothetical protein
LFQKMKVLLQKQLAEESLAQQVLEVESLAQRLLELQVQLLAQTRQQK